MSACSSSEDRDFPEESSDESCSFLETELDFSVSERMDKSE
jgi:hypothetical protein